MNKEEINTIIEEQVLHNKLSFEINQELIHLMKRIIEIQQQNKKYKEVIDKAKSLNEEISHIIYEDFLEENVIGCKYLYERIKKQLDILKEVK